MKRRNPRFGYQRIAHQLALALDIEIDKDVVRRVLAKLYRPDPQQQGPSWLTLLGHTKDSLWSVDFFRCEALSLKPHWVMVVMDLFTRRIVGFSVHPGVLDGPIICRMFSQVIKQADALPRILSSDNDRYLNAIAGKPICAYLMSARLRPFPMFRCLFRSSRG